MGIGLILTVLLVAGLFLLLKDSGSARGLFNANAAASAETPLEILNKRYASGEIDTDEYEERKRELS